MFEVIVGKLDVKRVKAVDLAELSKWAGSECIRGLGDQMKRSIDTYEEIEELCSLERRSKCESDGTPLKQATKGKEVFDRKVAKE
jgi:hypothetical protein